MKKHYRYMAIVLIILAQSVCLAQSPNQAAKQVLQGPWTDKSLPPDKRADLLIEQMTLDEKISLAHNWWEMEKPLVPPQWLGNQCCYFPAIPRLGIPDLQMTDGRSGVVGGGQHARYATALPSALAYAASWDLKLAEEFGTVLGKETRQHGYGLVFSGTANIIREPRNGRNFECLGEDPILVGKMLGREMKATQAQQVIADINRYALNDQETARGYYNVKMDERTIRETDLLAFEIAIKESDVGTVMCADTKINGDYDCENDYLLNQTLKKDWAYKGWVLSDWKSDHSTVKAVLAGLDQELPWDRYLGPSLKAAVQKGEVPMARLDDMVHRMLRTEIALGVFDNPPLPTPVDPFAGAEVAQRVAEQSSVLLKNSGAELPLKTSRLKSIAVIGSHADVGVLSGAGSDQVDAGGGNAVAPGNGGGEFGSPVWHRSSPLKAIRAKTPAAKVEYDSGTEPAAAAKLAAASDVAIVFVHQHTTEGRDLPNISLPGNQDQLVSQVSAANPHTVVVLETGGPVLMPWLGKVSAVLEAWYPGVKGGEAIANILFGEVNPSGKLPVTFPKGEDDVPHHPIPEASQEGSEITYAEGLNVGYKWFDAEGKEPLFPFGFGLSYTTFAYSGLQVTPGKETTVSFNLANTGKRAGAEVVQIYAALPPSTGEPPKRLVAWDKIRLMPGESKPVTLTLNPLCLSIFSVDKHGWELPPGEYKIYVGGSSRNTPLSTMLRLP